MVGAVAFAAPASAHVASLQGDAKCADNGWTVDWTLTTGKTVVDGTIKSVEESAKGTTELTKLAKGQPVKQDDELTERQAFDNTVKSVTLTIVVQWDDPDRDRRALNYGGGHDNHHEATAKRTVTAPENCPTTPPPAPGEPTGIFEQDCDTITIGLDNPANGKEITLKFKTSKGETRTTVIKPGEKRTEKFSAVPGFTVTVTADGLEGGSQTFKYEKPADCSGSGGGLPVTGAAAGTIAGGAALLLAIGGVLFFLARRRKVTFTA